jgi:hypothetical protein
VVYDKVLLEQVDNDQELPQQRVWSSHPSSFQKNEETPLSVEPVQQL